MKKAIFEKAGQMKIVDVDRPTIEKPDDVIIKVVRTCVCGSDLWNFRGINSVEKDSENSGHEAIGIVEEVARASMALAKATAITLARVFKPNTFVSNMVNGRLLKFRASQVTTVKECLSLS